MLKGNKSLQLLIHIFFQVRSSRFLAH